MKTGLVLEGGAMRGMFTAGVLDVWMEQGITFDGAVGVSAGCVFGGLNFKSRQIGRVIRYNTKLCNEPRYCSFRNLLREGSIFSDDFCYREVPEVIDPFDEEAFEKNPMPLVAVATDLKTGRAAYHDLKTGRGDDLSWIKASASMPLLSRPVHVGGRILLDGGIADSIPLKYFQGQGYDRNVVICTRPAGYRKKPYKKAILALARISLKRFPHFRCAMKHRHEMYNDSLDYLEKQEKAGRVFVIRPPYAIPVSSTDRKPENLIAAYRMGREEANRQLEALLQFMNKQS